MSNTFTLELTLESDTAFSMGAGVSGSIDSEIQQDEYGLPYVNGRTLKGLLVNECSEVLYVLPEQQRQRWEKAARALFGEPGATQEEAVLHIGDAGIAPDLAHEIRRQIQSRRKLSREDVLNALTDVRRQTAMTAQGAPQDDSLRAIRTLIRGLTLYAPLYASRPLTLDEQALLSACVLSLRRAGLGRTRGKGKLQARLTNRPLVPGTFAKTESQSKEDLTMLWLKHFKQELTR